MLMRDPVHPEGPGRLVLVAGREWTGERRTRDRNGRLIGGRADAVPSRDSCRRRADRGRAHGGGGGAAGGGGAGSGCRGCSLPRAIEDWGQGGAGGSGLGRPCGLCPGGRGAAMRVWHRFVHRLVRIADAGGVGARTKNTPIRRRQPKPLRPRRLCALTSRRSARSRRPRCGRRARSGAREGQMVRLGTDVKAFRIHDVVMIVVGESLTASTDGQVKNSRASNANSGSLRFSARSRARTPCRTCWARTPRRG